MKFLLITGPRCGSSFFSYKLCGMFDNDSKKKYPGELNNYFTCKELGLIGEATTIKEKADNSKAITYNAETYVRKAYENLGENNFLKCMYNQVKSPNNIDLDSTKIIHLIRANTCLQAVSMQRSTKSGKFHVKDKVYKEKTTSTLSTDSGKIDIELDKEELLLMIKRQNNFKKKWYEALKGRDNAMTIYFEDISKPEFWNDEFILKLENFWGVQAVDEFYSPPHQKIDSYFNIINKEEVMSEELQQASMFRPDE